MGGLPFLVLLVLASHPPSLSRQTYSIPVSSQSPLSLSDMSSDTLPGSSSRSQHRVTQSLRVFKFSLSYSTFWAHRCPLPFLKSKSDFEFLYKIAIGVQADLSKETPNSLRPGTGSQ